MYNVQCASAKYSVQVVLESLKRSRTSVGAKSYGKNFTHTYTFSFYVLKMSGDELISSVLGVS